MVLSTTERENAVKCRETTEINSLLSLELMVYNKVDYLSSRHSVSNNKYQSNKKTHVGAPLDSVLKEYFLNTSLQTGYESKRHIYFRIPFEKQSTALIIFTSKLTGMFGSPSRSMKKHPLSLETKKQPDSPC